MGKRHCVVIPTAPLKWLRHFRVHGDAPVPDVCLLLLSKEAPVLSLSMGEDQKREALTDFSQVVDGLATDVHSEGVIKRLGTGNRGTSCGVTFEPSPFSCKHCPLLPQQCLEGAHWAAPIFKNPNTSNDFCSVNRGYCAQAA
mmetsp:Transcript_56259/g.134071  ORF Transcript_56259/g.134071 Transcript_56259/m.134071 type:complete len:142 (-) Transcript_56259:5-430(-)